MAKGNQTVSLADAQTQLEAAQAQLESARQASLASAQARLAELDGERSTLLEQIRELGGRATRRKASGSRASNEVNLITAVANVLKNSTKPLSTTDICELVKKGGYETTAENYPTMVAQSLSKLTSYRMGKSPVAVRPERGHYRAGSGMDRYLANPDNATVVDGE
jgi:multidrug efflux pump subunit AcrA (membrane-fusion protein)